MSLAAQPVTSAEGGLLGGPQLCELEWRDKEEGVARTEAQGVLPASVLPWRNLKFLVWEGLLRCSHS